MEEELKELPQSHAAQQAEIEITSKSPLVKEYEYFFSQIPKAEITERQFCEVLALGSIYTTKQDNESKNQIQLQIITHTQNFQIMRLKFQINFLIFELNVLNLQTFSQTHNLINLSNTPASIFVDKQLIPNTVVKCLPIREDSFMESFLQAVKEYCLFKYASLMRIGPKISNIFGFDLIISQKCIEFCMEKCQPVLSITQGQARQLKQKILKLHELQVVHLDIKPSNLSLSPSLKQLVFIDFGLSDTINQKLGHYTKTYFVGSLSYCSPEMLKCYQSGSSLFVDLFYNDMHAIQKTIKELQTDNNEKTVQECFGEVEQPKANKFKEFLLEITVKFKIYTGSLSLFKEPQLREYLDNNKQKIVQFCSKLVHSKIIEDLYLFFDPKYSDCQFSLINYSPNYTQSNNKEAYAGRQVKWYDYYQSFIKGLLIKKSYTNIGEYFPQDSSLKQIVLNAKVIPVLKKCDYYQKYVSYTDFQSSLSTFNERVQASRILLQYSKLSVQQQDCFSLIIQCQIHVLDYLIQNYEQVHISCYPILLYNLVVMEAVSDQELVEYYEKIGSLQIRDCKSRAFLLFKCRIMLRLLKFMINTKYSIRICDQRFQDIFCSKGLQIVNSPAFAKDKAFTFILYQINRCYQYSKLDKDPFKKYQSMLLTNRQQFTQSQIFSEVKIYYIISMMMTLPTQQAHLQKINYFKKIADIQANRIRKGVKFEIYHFNLYQQYYALNNMQTSTNLFKCLEKCLGHQELVNKFVITNYEITLNWTNSYNYNLNFYIKFLNFLQNYPDIDLKILLSKLDFITKYYTSLFSMMNPQVFVVLQRILQNLRKRYPLNMLENFIHYYFNQFSKNDNIFGDSVSIAILFSKLYKQDPTLAQKINNLLNSIEDRMGDIQNKSGAYRCIFVIRAYYYKQNGQYQQLIESIKKYMKVCKNIYQRLYCLLQANYYCINYKEISHYQDQCAQLLYSFITQANLWHLLLSIHKSQKCLDCIHLYLLKRQMYSQLFIFHLRLVDYMKTFPIFNNICTYSRSLFKLFRMNGNIKTYVINHPNQQQKFRQNNYSALFFAVLLLQFDTSEEVQSLKIISILKNALLLQSLLLEILYQGICINLFLENKSISRDYNFRKKGFLMQKGCNI